MLNLNSQRALLFNFKMISAQRNAHRVCVGVRGLTNVCLFMKDHDLLVAHIPHTPSSKVTSSFQSFSCIVRRQNFSTSQRREGLAKVTAGDVTAKPKKKLKHEKQTQIPISELIPRCQGCGTPFQQQKAEEPGYRPSVEEDGSISFQDKKLGQYHNLYAKLDDKAKAIYSATAFEGQDAMILKNDSDLPATGKSETVPDIQQTQKLMSEHFTSHMFDRKIVNQAKLDKKNAINQGLCRTCRTRKGGAYVDLSGYPHPTTEQVISRIPEDGTIVHVISSHEFPASYIKDIRQYAGDRRVLYVVTKSDLTVDEHFKTRQRFLPYVQEELQKLDPTIQPENVFAVSAKIKWDIRDLFQSLPVDSYLVGLPNTGKSQLAYALGTLAKKEQQKAPLSLEMQQRFYSSSHVPLTTKYPLSYVNGGKRITDLPAVDTHRLSIYDYIQPHKLNSIVSGNVFMKRQGLPAAACHTLTKNNSVVSLGGLVFARMDNAPPNVHLIFWCTAGTHTNIIRTFGDLEVAKRNSANITRVNEAWFVNKGYDRKDPEQVEENEVQEVATGTVTAGGSDFVILGFGPLLVQISGPVPKEGVNITFFAKKGIEVHERGQILNYMKDFKISRNHYMDREKRPRRDGNRSRNVERRKREN